MLEHEGTPHHNFVVIALMIMKFGIGIKLGVFYTMVTRMSPKSWLRTCCVCKTERQRVMVTSLSLYIRSILVTSRKGFIRSLLA